MDRPLVARIVGAEQPEDRQHTELLVFDSYTNGSTYLSTAASPRTYTGMPVDFDATAGAAPTITRILVYVS